MAKRQLVDYVHLDRNTRVHVLARAKTAIVMSDHRSPTLGSSARATTLTYPALAFALNAMYACEHGYDLLFYQMASPACTHTSQGVRGASYCKLPAIAHALTRYEVVAFIDSDSFFLERNLSLPALVARYAPRSADQPATAAAWFANDLPQLGERANGGFHVWYRGSGTTRTLRTWWHLPAARFAVEHDFEQHALQWTLSHLADAVPLLGTLQMHAMADAALTFKYAIAHADHTKAARRLWVMSIELLDASLEDGPSNRSADRDDAAKRRRRKRASLVREARSVPSMAEPPDPLLQRVLRAAATELREGHGLPGHKLTLNAPEGRCPAGGRMGGKGSWRTLAYNASEMASEELPAADLLGAAGLPLVLLPCSGEDGGGSDRGDGVGAGGVGAGGGSGAAAGGGVVSSALQEWQRLEGGGWRLAGRPAFCLGAGPRKAAKTPYPHLASLHRCPRPHHGSDTSYAALTALTAVGVDGEVIRTLAPLAVVRQALRAAAKRGRASGPQSDSQSDSQSVQPREPLPSSRAVRRRLSASPFRERQSASRRLRERKPGSRARKAPFWQDGSLKVSSMTTHLCLSTWRAQLGVGAAVVFTPCVLDASAREHAAAQASSSGGDHSQSGPMRLTVLPSRVKGDVAKLQLGDAGRAGALCVSARIEGVSWD
jgi:hypothetical protein